MSDEQTQTAPATPAPAPTATSATPAAEAPKAPVATGKAPDGNSKDAKKPEATKPGADKWAAQAQAEKRNREAAERIKAEREAFAKEREAFEAERKAAAEKITGTLDALIERGAWEDVAKRLGPSGYDRITKALLKNKGSASPVAVEEVVKREVEKARAEDRKAAEEAAKKAADEQKAQYAAAMEAAAKESSEKVVAGKDERYELLHAVTARDPSLLRAMLTDADAALVSPEGWVVGGQTYRGRLDLDKALDLLESELVAHYSEVGAAKKLKRSQQVEGAPPVAGSDAKSAPGGPATLTQRLSQEASPAAAKAEASITDSPSMEKDPVKRIAKEQREQADALARAIAETEAAFKRKR